MGTSSIYEGPIDKNKLIPPDYDGTDNDKQDESIEEPWKNTKKLMTQYIKGSNNNLRGVVQNYIKASGGSQKITQNSKSGIKSTVNLGQLFSNIKQNGLEKTFKDLKLLSVSDVNKMSFTTVDGTISIVPSDEPSSRIYNVTSTPFWNRILSICSLKYFAPL